MLLGLDVGTSSLKAMLLDPAGESEPVLAREPLCQRAPAPDRAEMDPEEVYAAVARAVGRLRQDHPARVGAIRAVGLSTIFPALVPLRGDGSALGPAILYNDRRAVAQAEHLAAGFGRDRFETLTGNRLTPGTCTLPGILWLRDREPERFRRTRVFGQLSTYLVRRLTGETVVDTSHTSLSGMVRSGAEEHWDEEILAAVGLDPGLLPRIVAPTSVAGILTREAAARCGLPEGIPVAAGCGDAPLAALGTGVFEAGQLFASAGSTDCLMVSASRPSGDPVFCNVRSPVPGLWLAIGTMSSGGASVKWFCEEVLGGTPDEMTRLAASAAPGSGGLCFLPYLQGERTPWWDPLARGAFTGLALTTGRKEMCRAVLEGVACGWRQIVELLERYAGRRAPELVCVGGGSGNPLHNRIKASLLGRPVVALRFAETTSLGAALIGGLAAGVCPTLAAAREATLPFRAGERFEPVPEWADTLEQVYAHYRELYPALRGLPRPPGPL